MTIRKIVHCVLAELIFVVFAFLVIFVIDNFSTYFALVTCSLIVHCYVYCFSHRSKKDLITVFLIVKIWGGLVCCFRAGKQIYTYFKTSFSSQKSDESTSQHSCAHHCGEVGSLENEINTIVLNVSQYYIHSWYDKISDNEEFVTYLNSAIKDTLVGLCSSISKVDRKKFSYLILQIYLHFFTHFLDAKKKSEKFKIENFEMKHWAMRNAMTEWCYLQSLVSSLLDTFGPSEYHNTLHSKYSPLLHTVVVEILTEHIMHPLLNILSDPSRLNAWLLKLLEVYSKKNENFNDVSSIEEYSSFNNINTPEDRTKPVILQPTEFNYELLPAEESFINYVTEEHSNQSRNMLTVPLELGVGDIGKIRKVSSPHTLKIYDEQDDSEDVHSFVSSGVKSSSNINLLDSDFSCLRAPKSEGCSPVSCDMSTIKRSRSADYIRQMPQLKALNVKDYKITLQGESNKMLVALKCDTNSSRYIEQAEEAIEVPPLFTDVKITDTFQQSEAGLLPYTLYCIQYSGVFHDTGKSSETPHFVKQVVSIKRRFREFLALQSRLEDNPSLKNNLKGIKGPSKWLALPFSNLDKKNIAERKSFLESYLQELCTQGPIAQSSELQEFLAYGGDARIAFVKKAADIGVPRIDKMLVRGVKGAIDMFRTALPNSPVDGGCSGENSSIPVKTTYEDASSDHRFQEHVLEFSNREPEVKEYVMNYIERFLENPSCVNDHESSYSKRTSLLRHVYKLNAEECCSCSGIWDTNAESLEPEEIPFGNMVTDLIVETLKFNQLNTGHLLSVMKLLCAPCIDRYIISKLDSISEEMLITALHMLHKSLWPEDTQSEKNTTTAESSVNVNKIMEYLEVYLEANYVTMNISCVRNFLLEKCYLFLSSIQHQQSTRCLLFHMFDLVIETLCSKEE